MTPVINEDHSLNGGGAIDVWIVQPRKIIIIYGEQYARFTNYFNDGVRSCINDY